MDEHAKLCVTRAKGSGNTSFMVPPLGIYVIEVKENVHWVSSLKYGCLGVPANDVIVAATLFIT